MDAAEQLIANAVVDQCASRENISVTTAEVESENNKTLSQIAPNMPEADQLRMLDELLKRRNISRLQWDMVMRRNAVLRKIADRRLIITDAMLQTEFNRRYGAKALVRHIQCASMTDAMNIMDLLDRQQDFAELAKKLSTNAQSAVEGGLLRPFSLDATEVPTNFRQAAFLLKEGQTSEVVQVGKDFHIIRLEKMLPPENVTLDSVKETLRAELREQRLTQAQSEVLQELLRNADVQFLNTTLKEQARLRKATGTVQ
jgi:foldase protein PrsA